MVITRKTISRRKRGLTGLINSDYRGAVAKKVGSRQLIIMKKSHQQG